MKKVFGSILFLVLAGAAFMFWPAAPVAAQSPSAFPYTYPMQNDPTTGTVQFTLTCMTSSGQAIECSGGASNGYRGICVANCGKNGSAWIAFGGTVPLIVDGTTTAQHYIQFGSTAGQGHDSGASTYPTSGGTVIGQVQTASTGAASVSMVNINPEASAASSGSSGAYTQICKTVGGTTINLAGTPAYTVTATCTIPAHTLDTTGKCLHIMVHQNTSSGTTTHTWQMTFGGTTTAASASIIATASVGYWSAYVCETGTNAQSLFSDSIQQGNSASVISWFPATTAAATTSSSQTLALQGACTSACSDVITPFQMEVDSY